MDRTPDKPKTGRPSLSGDGPTDDVIRCRVTATERELWTRAAVAAGSVTKSGKPLLSKWMRETLKRAAKRLTRGS